MHWPILAGSGRFGRFGRFWPIRADRAVFLVVVSSIFVDFRVLARFRTFSHPRWPRMEPEWPWMDPGSTPNHPQIIRTSSENHQKSHQFLCTSPHFFSKSHNFLCTSPQGLFFFFEKSSFPLYIPAGFFFPKNHNFEKKPLRFSDSLRKININDGGFVISC